MLSSTSGSDSDSEVETKTKRKKQSAREMPVKKPKSGESSKPGSSKAQPNLSSATKSVKPLHLTFTTCVFPPVLRSFIVYF
uniref:Uncharacterized protein n=1 Tax=Amphiprion percula TaxID=161767 RepID=A0A3P8SWM7_AMPPE